CLFFEEQGRNAALFIYGVTRVNGRAQRSQKLRLFHRLRRPSSNQGSRSGASNGSWLLGFSLEYSSKMDEIE
ncbi:MAG: hypothetical protein ACRESF_13975, partial [Pseudomonas sp.]